MAGLNLIEVGALITGSGSTSVTGILVGTVTIDGVTGVTCTVETIGRTGRSIVLLVVAGDLSRVGVTIVFAFEVATRGSLTCSFSGGFITFKLPGLWVTVFCFGAMYDIGLNLCFVTLCRFAG